jgi:MFS family permease
VLNGYAIVYASLLVSFGRLADRYPREQGFLLGVAVFVAASAACGAATSVGELIVFRVVQAAGAALLTPTSLSLVLASVEPERRHGAVRAWSSVGGAAAALGPVIGGLLVAASWRWVFLVNVPIGIAALIAGWRLLPRVPGHPVAAPDPVGAALVTAGVGALTLGLVQGGSWGWGSGRVLGALGLAVVALGAFARSRSLGGADPSSNRSCSPCVRSPGRASSRSSFSAAFGAMLISRVLWAHEVWHWSALPPGCRSLPAH